MSIPPDFNIPDDVYQPGTGSQYGQNFQNMSMEQARNYLQAPYQVSFGSIGQVLLDTLNGILQSVVSGIVAGAQAVGMIVSGVIDTITAAIQWVTEGIASLFSGPGPGSPKFEVDSVLADAYDKQQELIGKVDKLMEDNAGFINLCMSHSANISWTPNRWLLCDFNTYVTDYKNAQKCEVWIENGFDGIIANSPSGRDSVGHGIEFLAPGVWLIEGQVTIDPKGDTNYRPAEVEIDVFEVTPSGTAYVNSLYSGTRYSTSTDANHISTASFSKPVIIPDDDKRYCAVLRTRFIHDTEWGIWGGALWTSLSATRQSVDTTTYGAKDEPAGTITITE